MKNNIIANTYAYVVWVSCTRTEQSTYQFKCRLLVLYLIRVVQYIADNQPFDFTILVWISSLYMHGNALRLFGAKALTIQKCLYVLCRTKQVCIIFNVFGMTQICVCILLIASITLKLDNYIFAGFYLYYLLFSRCDFSWIDSCTLAQLV